MGWKEIELKKDFWKPVTEGDVLEGVIIGKEAGDFGDVWIVEYEKGVTTKTPPHKILQELMKEVEIGKRIRLIYKGEKQSQHPKPVQIYKLMVWEND